MPNILVVNDDGIESELIHFLANKLQKYGKVIVCAPIEQKSAYSHMINIFSYNETNIIKDDRYEYEAYMINGSPADCVRYACDFLNTSFDYVFSGVNKGTNAGLDVYYSGTISAAIEASIRGIKACALSANWHDQKTMKDYLEDTLDKVFQEELLSNKYMLNINYPLNITADNNIYRYTRQFLFEHNDTDVDLLAEGYVTLTPLILNRTDYLSLEELKKRK